MNTQQERFLRDAHILARLVEQILEAGYLQRASGDALTFDQLNILKFLARPKRSHVKDVAMFLNASFPAASKAVTRLEKKGLVRSHTFAADRRHDLVEVSAKGWAFIRRYERLKEARLAALLQGEKLDQLSEGLERVIGVLMRERTVAGNPCMGCGVYYAKECVVRAHGQSCPCQKD